MQIYSFYILSNLVDILFWHDLVIIFKNLVMLHQESLNVGVKLMGLVEKSQKNFDTQVLTNLKDLSVLSDHFSEDC